MLGLLAGARRRLAGAAAQGDAHVARDEATHKSNYDYK